jgi:hypothetical protein
MSESPNTPATAHEAMLELSSRIYRADALVATAAAATQASPPLEPLDLQYTLDAASKLLLEIASDVEFVGRRMQWAPEPEGAPL